jgi:hypothetical protein
MFHAVFTSATQARLQLRHENLPPIYRPLKPQRWQICDMYASRMPDTTKGKTVAQISDKIVAKAKLVARAKCTRAF